MRGPTSALATVACVVFDFDGTLVNSNALKREAYFEIFSKRGIKAETVETALRETTAGDRFDTIRAVLQRQNGVTNLDEETVKTLATEYNAICEIGAATCPEMPGAGKLLVSLHSALPLFINSATPVETLRNVIRQRGWIPFFQGIYGRPTDKLENLKQISSFGGWPPTQLLFVGDSLLDAAAARKIGCQFVSTGEFPRKSSPQTTYVSSLLDLQDLLACLTL